MKLSMGVSSAVKLVGLGFYASFLLLVFQAILTNAEESAPKVSAFSWNNEALSVLLTGRTNKLVLQESSDLRHWVDSAWVPTGSNFKIPSGYQQRFFRVAAPPALPPPSALPDTDIFYPFVNLVPASVEILSDEVVDEVRVRELRFAWFEGTDDGSVSTNAIFAIMANPLVPPSNKMPAILSCHGGYLFPERSVCIEWAKRGFVAIAPELPGIVNPLARHSLSRVVEKPYNADLLQITPNARAGTIFDCIMAGLGAFNLLGTQPGVDKNAMYIEGASFGGYITLVLAGLLDTRVARVFSLYGCGFHLIDTLLTVPLLAKSADEQKEWVDNLDASARMHRVRATVLIFTASNDSSFRPPSVNATFDAILSEKYICYSANENHSFTLPGGRSSLPGTTWVTIEPEFFLDSTNQFSSPLPKITRGEWQGRTLMFDVSALPSGATVWAYASAPPYQGWGACDWVELRISPENGRFRMFFPEQLNSCFWFAGLFFNYPGGGSPMSLSTPAYYEDLSFR